MDEPNNRNVTEFRDQIQDITLKMDELSLLMPEHTKENMKVTSTNQMHELLKGLDQLPANEAEKISNVFLENPDWIRLPALIDDVILQLRKYQAINTVTNLKLAQANSGCSLGNCPQSPTQDTLDQLLIGVAAADLAASIATAVANTISIFLDKAGKIAMAIASGLDVITKTLALAASIVQREVDAIATCEENAVQQLLLNMCTTIMAIDSKMDDAIGKLEIIDQKLDVILKLTQEIKEIVDEILLHQIEEALSECKQLISLELSDKYKGSLEKIQQIIRNLIDLAKLSGFTTGNAESYYKQGTIALNNNQNENALHWFMMAYHQLQFKNMCEIHCLDHSCGCSKNDE